MQMCGYVVPPVIARAPEHTTAITGSTVTLECSINSTVPVNVTWTTPSGSDILLVLTTPTSGITYDGHLNLTDVTSEDSGPYICAGVTIAGRAIAAADVIIGSKLCILPFCNR